MAYRVFSANDDDSQAPSAKPDETLGLYRVLPLFGRRNAAADFAGDPKLAGFCKKDHGVQPKTPQKVPIS
jgi:hypothetical protein